MYYAGSLWKSREKMRKFRQQPLLQPTTEPHTYRQNLYRLQLHQLAALLKLFDYLIYILLGAITVLVLPSSLLLSPG